MTQIPSKMDNGPGQVFIDGREALGMTRKQAAESLNLSVRAIAAIEDDDADSLPGIVYVNGYIRSYAKLLGIASQPLIDAWRAQHAMPEDKAAQLNTSRGASKVDAVNVRPMKMGRWALIALGLSAFFVYFVAFTDDAVLPEPAQEIASVSNAGEPDSIVVDITAAETSIAAAVVDEVLGDDTVSEDKPSIGAVAQQAAGQDENSEENAEETTEASAAETVEEASEERIEETIEEIAEETAEETAEESLQDVVAAAVEEEVAEEVNLGVIPDEITAIEASAQTSGDEVAQIGADASQAEPEREVAKAFALPRLTEFGDNTIDLTFSEDCWFEIRTINGELLYADLGRTGQSRRYIGAAPFRVKLGFSPGAALTYNGEPIDLAPYTRQEVARVLLSEQEAEDTQEALEEQEPPAADVEEPINSVEAISLW